MITATHIRRWTQDVLTAHLAAHIDAAAADPLVDMTDMLPTPRVRSWTRLPDYRALDEGQSPAIIVTSTGLTGTPDREARDAGGGDYRASWQVTVYCFVRATTYHDVADLVGLYTGAIRECLLQRRLPGHSASVEWMDEGYNEVDTDDARSIGAGQVTLRVSLADVVTDLLPPIAPDGTQVQRVIVTSDSL